jgi:hypothetical protein
VNLLLTRDLRETYCTLGVLTLNDHKLHTIERPWIPNPDGGKSGKRFESCVSDGIYKLEQHASEKYGKVWALINPALDVYHYPGDVPKGREAQCRAACLIHAANWAHEVLGCIAPGRNRIKLNNEWMVQQSRDAMNVIKTIIGTRLDVTLTIQWTEATKP